MCEIVPSEITGGLDFSGSSPIAFSVPIELSCRSFVRPSVFPNLVKGMVDTGSSRLESLSNLTSFLVRKGSGGSETSRDSGPAKWNSAPIERDDHVARSTLSLGPCVRQVENPQRIHHADLPLFICPLARGLLVTPV